VISFYLLFKDVSKFFKILLDQEEEIDNSQNDLKAKEF